MQSVEVIEYSQRGGEHACTRSKVHEDLQPSLMPYPVPLVLLTRSRECSTCYKVDGWGGGEGGGGTRGSVASKPDEFNIEIYSVQVSSSVDTLSTSWPHVTTTVKNKNKQLSGSQNVQRCRFRPPACPVWCHNRRNAAQRRPCIWGEPRPP